MKDGIYEESELNEIDNRFHKGGILYLIERTDTNKFLYYDHIVSSIPGEVIYPKPQWSNEIWRLISGTEMFLTKEDAENNNRDFREGGCEYCGNGSKQIPTIVTEHEFIQPQEEFKFEDNAFKLIEAWDNHDKNIELQEAEAISKKESTEEVEECANPSGCSCKDNLGAVEIDCLFNLIK